MRTKEEMYHLIDGWSISGLTQKQYCKEVGINLSTFAYWVNKKKATLSETSGFVKVDTSSPISLAVIEIGYPNGVKLTLQRLDLALVSQLIRLY